MGCICSKGSAANDNATDDEEEKERESNRSPVQAAAPLCGDEVKVVVGASEGSAHSKQDVGVNGVSSSKPGIASMPGGVKGEQCVAGWPFWLTSVAGEAIQGWLPRREDSFEILNKIGQGTYSSVYRARDLTNDNIVAMKKVRCANMDPESVRFMAREICILRRLDHPNVIKLRALVIPTISSSLFLVFDYMEHDLSGLATALGVRFSEPQIKCYMQQMLSGLEHCHSRGVLHRDIKGANILIDNNGILKIGDFGLANYFQPDQTQPLTSRVVTLWYRAPELLLGATEYRVAIDMWSAGCIIAELFTGKPIMPGRTEVEQMHKIFKLCGSPSEEYWQMSKLPHATSFKPQRPYRRRVADTFKDFPRPALALVETLLSIEPDKRGTAATALDSNFFTTKPLPCDPSSLPKYPPSKEFDTRVKEDAISKKSLSVKGGGFMRKNSRGTKITPTVTTRGRQEQSNKSTSVSRYNAAGSGNGFPIEQPPRVNYRSGITHSTSVIHPNATSDYAAGQTSGGRGYGSSHRGVMLLRQGSQFLRLSRDGRASTRDTKVYAPVKSRTHYSGPLVSAGGNMEEMLKEHERHIQEAVRKARMDKVQTK